MDTNPQSPLNAWKKAPKRTQDEASSVEDAEQSYDYGFSPKQIFHELTSDSASEVNLLEPDLSLDQEITGIFRQAHEQRKKLLTFYIWFTIVLSAFVVALILLQAWTRIRLYDESIAIVPDNVFYFLVTGMFLQFIGLLTIVTKSVWSYTDFFQYKRDISNGTSNNSSIDL